MTTDRNSFMGKHAAKVALAGAFVFPVLIMLMVFAIDGIYPFGNATIFNSDLTNIYANYLAHYKDMVLGGDGVFWSWNIGAGYNMYSYFIDNTSSPLNLILLMVPDQNLPEGVLIIQLIRVGLIGLSAAWYLEKHEAQPQHAFALACAYALSAYTVCFFQHVMWLDSLAVLPLVVFATEKMVQQRKVLNLPLLGALVLAFWCSYYLGYMTALFLALYTIYLTVCGGDGLKRTFFNLCKLALCGVFTFALLGFAIMPSIFANLGSGGFTDLSAKPFFDFTDITYGLFFGNFDTYNRGGRPLLYCGLFTLYLVMLYFGNREIERREKICTAVLFGVFYASLAFAPFYYAWHMFDEPDWFEARFSFAIIFFMIIVAARCLQHPHGIRRRSVLVCCAILLVVLGADTIVCNALPDADTYTAKIGSLAISNSTHKLAWPLVALNAFALVAYAACSMPLFGKNPKARRFFRTFLLIACMLELAASTVVLNQYVSHFERYESRSAFNDQRSTMSALVKDAQADSGSATEDFRIEKTFSRQDNDALTDDYYGLTMFGSGYNPQVHDALHQMGLRSLLKVTRYQGSTPVTDSLLGISYVMQQQEVAPPADQTDTALNQYRKNLGGTSEYIETLYTKIAEENGVGAYRNDWALPMAYLVDNDLADVDVNASTNPFTLQNEIVQKAFGTDTSCFTECSDMAIDAHGVTCSTDSAGNLVLASDGSQANPYVDITVSAQSDQPVFVYATTVGSATNVDYQVWDDQTGSFVSKTYDYDTTVADRIVQLQNHDGSYTYRLVLHATESTVTYPTIWSLDTNAFENVFTQHRSADLISEFTSNRIELDNVSTDQGRLLFLSIPYDKGWKATMNGQPVQIEQVLTGFSGIQIPDGTSDADIVLTYTPIGWDEGLALTGIGAIALAAWCIIGFALSKRKKDPLQVGQDRLNSTVE